VGEAGLTTEPQVDLHTHPILNLSVRKQWDLDIHLTRKLSEKINVLNLNVETWSIKIKDDRTEKKNGGSGATFCCIVVFSL
jgi:hypothetical protein